MSLIEMLIIAAATLAFLAYFMLQIFLKNRKKSKEYEKTILNLPTQGDGWIELASTDFNPLISGKILYSFNRYAIGVGILVKEHLPAELAADIDARAGVQLLDGFLPLCQFIIDCQGQEITLTELKDMQLREKLKPYVDNYSKIELMIGLESSMFVLVDDEEGKSIFEQVWQETKHGNRLES